MIPNHVLRKLSGIFDFRERHKHCRIQERVHGRSDTSVQRASRSQGKPITTHDPYVATSPQKITASLDPAGTAGRQSTDCPQSKPPSRCRHSRSAPKQFAIRRPVWLKIPRGVVIIPPCWAHSRGELANFGPTPAPNVFEIGWADGGPKSAKHPTSSYPPKVVSMSSEIFFSPHPRGTQMSASLGESMHSTPACGNSSSPSTAATERQFCCSSRFADFSAMSTAAFASISSSRLSVHTLRPTTTSLSPCVRPISGQRWPIPNSAEFGPTVAHIAPKLAPDPAEFRPPSSAEFGKTWRVRRIRSRLWKPLTCTPRICASLADQLLPLSLEAQWGERNFATKHWGVSTKGRRPSSDLAEAWSCRHGAVKPSVLFGS